MTTFLKRVLTDRSGTSAIEMGLICSLIVLTMLTALQSFSEETRSTWDTINTETGKAVQKAVK